MTLDLTRPPMTAQTIHERARLDNIQVAAWTACACVATALACISTAEEYKFIFWAAVLATALSIFWAAECFYGRPFADIDGLLASQLPGLETQSAVVANYLDQVRAQERRLTIIEFNSLRNHVFSEREKTAFNSTQL